MDGNSGNALAFKLIAFDLILIPRRLLLDNHDGGALSRVRSTAKPLALDNESAGVIKAGRRRGINKINREGSVQNTDRGSPPDRR